MAVQSSNTQTESRAELFEQLLLQTAATFFRMRALGRTFGAVTSWGGGSWGLMRTLHQQGPHSIAEIARQRPVSRQRIQKLASELAEEGLIEFIDNPAHQRSKLMKLTERGEQRFLELSGHLSELAEQITVDASPEELATAVAVLRRLTARIDEQLENGK
jgi:DNA-binding MarR family transcriptional regulator